MRWACLVVAACLCIVSACCSFEHCRRWNLLPAFGIITAPTPTCPGGQPPLPADTAEKLKKTLPTD
jgi:hypothetical protein